MGIRPLLSQPNPIATRCQLEVVVGVTSSSGWGGYNEELFETIIPSPKAAGVAKHTPRGQSSFIPSPQLFLKFKQRNWKFYFF
jgi:hypothetical protein